MRGKQDASCAVYVSPRVAGKMPGTVGDAEDRPPRTGHDEMDLSLVCDGRTRMNPSGRIAWPCSPGSVLRQKKVRRLIAPAHPSIRYKPGRTSVREEPAPCDARANFQRSAQRLRPAVTRTGRRKGRDEPGDLPDGTASFIETSPREARSRAKPCACNVVGRVCLDRMQSKKDSPGAHAKRKVVRPQ